MPVSDVCQHPRRDGGRLHGHKHGCHCWKQRFERKLESEIAPQGYCGFNGTHHASTTLPLLLQPHNTTRRLYASVYRDHTWISSTLSAWIRQIIVPNESTKRGIRNVDEFRITNVVNFGCPLTWSQWLSKRVFGSATVIRSGCNTSFERICLMPFKQVLAFG